MSREPQERDPAISAQRAVLMGDPFHFSIRGGANPHTRTPWGWRKKVDRTRAIAQWHNLARTLEAHGITVFVVPATPECPGLVYPANAGALYPVDQALAPARKRFILSNLVPTRAAEQPIYAWFLRGLGIPTVQLRARFEGEADFFPAGNYYLLTHGRIERQRFAPRLGMPPYRRVYGFRTDIAAAEELASLAPGAHIVPLELADEAFYHGDTVLCAFGPGRQHLLAYLDGLTRPAAAQLEWLFGDHLIPLEPGDAELYAANSYSCVDSGGAYLFMPAGVSDRLVAQVRERAVEPVLVDVSEFLRKGGGSVKCMICDLGPWSEEGVDQRVGEFRTRHRYAAPA